MRQLTSILLGLFILTGAFTACNKNSGDDTDEKIDFGCFLLFDQNGQAVGTYDACNGDKDWQKLTLSSEEKAYLNFPENISITHNKTINITDVAVFPNPVSVNGFFSVFLHSAETVNADVKVKFALVNETKEVLGKQALQLQFNGKSSNFLVGLSAFQIPSRQPLRLFYQVFGAQNQLLFESYGDLLFCGESTVNDIELDCF